MRRRRSALPFQTATAPWICWCFLATKQTLHKASSAKEESTRHDVCTDRRDHVIDLKLWLIVVVPTWHSLTSKHELREEGDVESDKDDDACDDRSFLVVHPTSHLRPPMMQSADHSNQCRTHHDIVEMRDDKICVMQVHVGIECRQMDSSQSTNCKKEDE